MNDPVSSASRRPTRDNSLLPAFAANGPVECLDYPDLERILFRRSFARMRRAEGKHPLPDIPLSVISKGLPFGLPDDHHVMLTQPQLIIHQARRVARVVRRASR